jgi:hypothetical protein
MNNFFVNQRPCLCALVVLLLSATSPHDLFSQEDQSRFLNKILESQDVRKSVYDTGHFAWIKTDKYESGEVKVMKYEFRALHGKFYRLDTRMLKQDDTGGTSKTGIIIARPEGFALFHTSDGEKPAALKDFGSFDGGKARIFGTYVLNRADRLGLEYLNPIIRLRADDPEIKDLKFFETESNDYIVSYSRAHPEGDQHYEARLDRTDHHVLSWKYHFRGKDGVRNSHQTAIQEYGGSQRNLPIKVAEKVNANFEAGIVETDINLVHYDASPPPIEVFEVDGFPGTIRSPANTWTRRLVFLAIGISLLAIYYNYRKQNVKK